MPLCPSTTATVLPYTEYFPPLTTEESSVPQMSDMHCKKELFIPILYDFIG